MPFTISFPSFPEGSEMTPDEFLAWITNNATIETDGEALGGQYGGTRPTTNVGLYVTDGEVEVWNEDASKYLPAASVPVGCCLPWAGTSASIPNNFLLCDGSTVLRADYPELFTALGTTWNEEGDDVSSFRLPDLRGRLVMGSGTGEYKDIDAPNSLPERTAGTYVGQHYPKNIVPWTGHQSSGASKWTEASAFGDSNSSKTAEMTQPAAVMQYIIRSR